MAGQLRIGALQQQQQQQQVGHSSPLAKFTRCNRLSIEASGVPEPVGAALAGTTPADRQRITHLSITGQGLDTVRVVEAAAAALPCLEGLQLAGGECANFLRGQHLREQQQQGGVCSAIAAGLPLLQRLDLELRTTAELTSLGTLAGCRRLRDLQLNIRSHSGVRGSSSRSSSSAPHPMSIAVEGLSQLQQLECLAIRGDEVREWGEQALLLLGSRRPPNMRSLALFSSAVEVSYEPRGLNTADWGISRIQLDMPKASSIQQLLAPGLLAAADSLRQHIIPELVFSTPVKHYWEVPAAMLEPGGSLPQLLARCERVQLERLPILSGTRREPSAVVKACRLMGLPRVLCLQHGTMLCRDEVGTGTIATAAGAVSAEPEVQDHANQLQQLDLHGPGGARGSSRSPLLLYLGTATPEQVLTEAVERLWEDAVRGSSGFVLGGAGAGSDSEGSGEESGVDRSSNAMEQQRGLLLIRGTLPPEPDVTYSDNSEGEPDWDGWLDEVLTNCFAADSTSGDGSHMLPGHILQRVRDGSHVAAPAVGVLLLDCSSAADAAALAALAPAAGDFSAAVIPALTADSMSADDVLMLRVLQVFTDAWALPTTTTNCSSTGSTSRASEEALARLERLLTLDREVNALWAYAEFAVDEENEWANLSTDYGDYDSDDW
ncbi:hypothetical protein HYH02_004432 [Chlamydomonas schloesseri]|uniref:Uncharacterized protein n=1 Tax=Chlamydomonas schloesseri TaxID=2026947 RepID=A0A836B869_9CHLO|nr:hypothetical protein HYH02_004432 [Chlamydomonas schloesseri]|eukprot:KAG2450592.1 hypothetical protein HYH02_004432 [Chlamydomonas schloesseri]